MFNGISEDKAFYNLSNSDIDNIMKVNLIIPLKITQLFLKNYLSNKVNFIYMSSSRALKGDKGITIYSASKSGLKFASKSPKFLLLPLLVYCPCQGYFFRAL